MLGPIRLDTQALCRLISYQAIRHTAKRIRMSARMTTTTSPSRLPLPKSTTPQNPLIVIIGSTGTGKSNLAIQLAHYLSRTQHNHHRAGAEILNADAMQLYRGMPITTNKMSPAEQEGIPHHLLDHIGLEEEPWTVQRFVKEADQVIDQIRKRNKTPIVVGGTGYYVHGLLIRDAVLERQERGTDSSDDEYQNQSGGEDVRSETVDSRVWPILDASTEEIYTKLQEVDPVMAQRWHPKDRRKIQRSLEIYLKTGKKASQVYEQQQQGCRTPNESAPSLGDEFEHEKGVPSTDTSLRYDPIIFWLDARDKDLKTRLDKRFDSMIINGLLDEAQDMGSFETDMTKKGVSIDKSKGVWVSIGYKEMEPWVQASRNEAIHEKELSKLELSCVEAVKAGTRRYAKRQNRYIRIRFANVLSRAHARNKLFLLDCTDLEKWRENVQDPAQNIVDSFMLGEELPDPETLSVFARDTFANIDGEGDSEKRVQRRCDICDKTLMTEKEWVGHTNSRSHKRVLEGVRRRERHEPRREDNPPAADSRLG